MRILLILGSLTVVIATAFAAPSGVLDVKSTLVGIVLADDLVEEGMRVDEGQPLVYVRTILTGAKAPAAVSPVDGVVREILVRPGQRIEQGDIVVRVAPR